MNTPNSPTQKVVRLVRSFGRWAWTPSADPINRYLGLIAMTMVTGLCVVVVIVGAMK